MKIMKCIFLTTFTLFLFSINAFSKDIITKEINKVKDSLADTANASKHILTPPKTAKNKIEKSLSKINSECCAENFKYKKDLLKIKDTFENCLNKKCQNYMIPLFSVKKPPLKIIALRQIDLVDTLLLENEKQKYDNLVKKMELDLNEKTKIERNAKIKNEKNIQIIKDQLLKKEKENEKLKKTVNKMLANYQKKISALQKEKLTLEENFNLVFEAHSKSKQKKLSEKLN
jgi:hypothetical protein